MTANCPLCGTRSPLYFHARDMNRRLSPDVFRYHRCPACRTIFLAPVPANLGDYYPSEYYTMPASLEHLAAGAAGEHSKIEVIERFVRKGRLLEIGPAVGYFAYLARQKGFEVEAIEMDERCCRFLNEVAGVRAINTGDVPGALATAEPYDVIALWHVVEHLPDPWEVLEAAARRLLPAGVLAIAAPNPAAFQFQVLRRYWAHVDAPRHLLLIPARTLIERAEALGLKTVLVTTSDTGALGWNTFGWRESLANLSGGRTGKRVLRRIGGLLEKRFGPVERGDLRGSTYTLVFQKGERA